MNLAGLKIDDSKARTLSIADEQAAMGFHSMVRLSVTVVIFREWQFDEFLGFQSLGGHDLDGVSRRGVVNQACDLFRQASAIADDELRLGNSNTVLGSAVPRVGVSAGRHQDVDRHPVTPDVGDEISEHRVAGDHIDWVGRLCGGWRRRCARGLRRGG